MTEPEKVEVKYRGRQVTGTPVGFKPVGTHGPMSFELEDGSQLSIQFVLVQCLRIEGEYTENGDPLYLFRQGAIPTVVSPPSLKKKMED